MGNLLRKSIIKQRLICNILFSLGFCCSGHNLAFAKIKIGVIGPLSGDMATYGIPVKNGVELAVKEINAKGGKIGRAHV